MASTGERLCRRVDDRAQLLSGKQSRKKCVASRSNRAGRIPCREFRVNKFYAIDRQGGAPKTFSGHFQHSPTRVYAGHLRARVAP